MATFQGKNPQEEGEEWGTEVEEGIPTLWLLAQCTFWLMILPKRKKSYVEGPHDIMI